MKMSNSASSLRKHKTIYKVKYNVIHCGKSTGIKYLALFKILVMRFRLLINLKKHMTKYYKDIIIIY